MRDTVELKKIVDSQLQRINVDSMDGRDAKVNALKNFEQLGFPSTRNEEWKYTPTLSFSKSAIDYALNYIVKGTEDITASAFESEHKIVFINGAYSAAHSLHTEDIELLSIAEAQQHAKYIAYFNSLANNAAEPYTAMNTAFYQEGIFLVVRKNSEVKSPILIEFHEDKESELLIQQIRNLIVFETGAQASIIVKHYVDQKIRSLSNTMTELILEPNAHCDLYQIQDQLGVIQHINTWEIAQNRDSVINFFSYSDSGSLVRNNVHIQMNAPGLTCDTKGIYIADKKNIIDNHLKIEHKFPHCSSFQLYRGIMKEEGTGVFNGKIFVHKDAQKTDAYQSNKNLLLSANAYIYTKPQLEIFADDVKCSHGATIGNLDENALFYCLARGISESTAKALLTRAFANEVIKKMHNYRVMNYVEQAMTVALETTT